jgi:CMP-N,N'-diacetyllegionaminic acid synthase
MALPALTLARWDVIGSQTVLALIPARGGSRGIPRKNIADLAGMPLIQWTINAAMASVYIDSILISTDDPDVKALALEQGIGVLDRPQSIAGDSATAAEVIAHALTSTGHTGILVYLQPTSPFRESDDIDRSLELLGSGDAEGVVSVTEAAENPEWMYRLSTTDSGLEPIVPHHSAFRRQDLPRTVKLNGAVYCADTQSLLPDGSFFKLRLAGYEMPASRSIDIDDPEDLELARQHVVEERG